jgi:hypothetical protein
LKNDNGGFYEYSYEFDDKFGGHVGVRYAVDNQGEIVKNEEGNYGYQVSYTYRTYLATKPRRISLSWWTRLFR